MKLIAIMLLVWSTAAFAKNDCKAQCAAVRGPCKSACEDPAGAGKTKKGAAECVKRTCEMAVQQCEQACGGSNAKKR